MKSFLIGIILVLTSSMVLSDQVSPQKTKKHQLQIDRETGLDGKVRSIRLDSSEDAAGVRVYGIPKNKMIDSRKVEKSEPKAVLRGDPRGGNRVQGSAKSQKGVPADENGHIERVSVVDAEQGDVKVIKIVKRSTAEGLGDLKSGDDLEAKESNVFRPLFVYRQQVNRRNKKYNAQKKNLYPKKYNPNAAPKPRAIYYPSYPSRVYY